MNTAKQHEVILNCIKIGSRTNDISLIGMSLIAGDLGYYEETSSTITDEQIHKYTELPMEKILETRALLKGVLTKD